MCNGRFSSILLSGNLFEMSAGLIIAYLILLSLGITMPFFGRLLPRPSGATSNVEIPIVFFICCMATLLAALRLGPWIGMAIVLAIPLWRHGLWSTAGGLASISLFCTGLWWVSQVPQPSHFQLLLFVALALSVPWLPYVLPEADKAIAPKALTLLSLLVLLPLGIAVGLFTGAFDAPFATAMAWHHWSAYLSPVDSLLAGYVPFRDFPIQYGLGPTLLLGASCGQNCWNGLFNVAVAANALYFVAIAICAILLTTTMGRGLRIMSVAAAFCATLIWTGFPKDFVGPLLTPSVAGLRFLPITLLLLHILYREHVGKPWDWPGHVIWLVDVFWSPEAAFFASVLWWPYLALRNNEAGANPVKTLFIGGVTGAAALTGVIGAGAAIFRVAYGSWPSATDYLAYVLYPPAALPPNPFGAIWLALAIVVIALTLLGRRTTDTQTRQLYAALLSLLAAGSYYLSRAHDNNILNLFPLLLLVALASLPLLNRSPELFQKFGSGFIKTLIGAMIAGPALFGTASSDLAWQNGHVGQMGAGPLISSFTPSHAAGPQTLDPDALAAIDYAQSRTDRSVLLFDHFGVMPSLTPGRAWTSVNSVINFLPLPRQMIETYIRRGADACNCHGWLILDNNGFSDWLNRFQTAYTVAEAKQFGHYTAYHLRPRQQPPL